MDTVSNYIFRLKILQMVQSACWWHPTGQELQLAGASPRDPVQQAPGHAQRSSRVSSWEQAEIMLHPDERSLINKKFKEDQSVLHSTQIPEARGYLGTTQP